jgi:hypothetical protein
MRSPIVRRYFGTLSVLAILGSPVAFPSEGHAQDTAGASPAPAAPAPSATPAPSGTTDGTPKSTEAPAKGTPGVHVAQSGAPPVRREPTGPNPVVTGGEAPQSGLPGVPAPTLAPVGPAKGEPPAPAPGAPPVVAPPPVAAPTPGEAPADQGPPPATQDDLNGLRTDLENFKYQWQHENDIHHAQSTRNLTINGLIQTRFGYTDVPVFGSTIYDRHTSFDIGAAQIIFNGNLYKDYQQGRNLSYSLRFGTSPPQTGTSSPPNLLDANITYSPFPTTSPEDPVFQITLGQQLIPFGIEVTAPDELKPLILNAEFSTRLNLARRDAGLIIRGDLFPQVDYGYNYRANIFSYALGIVNGGGLNLEDDNNFKNVIARLAFTVPNEGYNSWLRQITIGATGYWGVQNTYVNTGLPANTGQELAVPASAVLAGLGIQRRLGLDLYYNHWPFGFTYESVWGTDVSTPGATLANPQRTNVYSFAQTATLFLSFGTQFVAGYNAQAKFDDYWPKTYQPFVRLDYFNPNIDKHEGKVDILTLGFNVFLAETTKFQINYARRHDTSGLPLIVGAASPFINSKLPYGVQNELLAQFQFGF